MEKVDYLTHLRHSFIAVGISFESLSMIFSCLEQVTFKDSAVESKELIWSKFPNINVDLANFVVLSVNNG